MPADLLPPVLQSVQAESGQGARVLVAEHTEDAALFFQTIIRVAWVARPSPRLSLTACIVHGGPLAPARAAALPRAAIVLWRSPRGAPTI